MTLRVGIHLLFGNSNACTFSEDLHCFCLKALCYCWGRQKGGLALLLNLTLCFLISLTFLTLA